MNKKLLSIFVVVLFMSIGFAALVISINIEGESKIAFNEADFNIFFSKVAEGGVAVNYQITTSDCENGTFNGSSCTTTETVPHNVSYSCSAGWTRVGSQCTKSETICDEHGDPTCNAAGTYCYEPCYRSHENVTTIAASPSYSCPGGYTGSGSGASLTCSRNVTADLTNNTTFGGATVLGGDTLVHSFIASKPGTVTFKSTTNATGAKCFIRKESTVVVTDTVEESGFTCSYTYDSGDYIALYFEGAGEEKIINGISEDGDSFTYTSNGHNAVNYYVINRSVNYNAIMNVSCDQETAINQENDALMAGTIESGTVSSSYVGDITCTLNALPTEREQQNKNDAIKVTFNPGEGTVDVNEFYVINGYKFGILPVPVLNGSYFAGWYKNTDFSGDAISEYTTVDLAEDTTLYALWIKPRGFICNGVEETYKAPISGIYKIQAWGAQGGSIGENIGGYGGYAAGNVLLHEGDILYINVGCQGDAQTESKAKTVAGGYNGGGTGFGKSDKLVAGGGGATSVSLNSGLLKNQFEHVSDGRLLLVAGGGGGAAYEEEQKYANGGHGGGTCGTMNYTTATGTVFYPKDPGCQTGTNFGYGTNADTSTSGSGGGGGFYGGQWGNFWSGGSGGSGYINSPLLRSSEELTKHMSCYNCDVDTNEDTKTNSVTCHYSTPTTDCAKENDGYVSVMFIDTVK